MTDLGAAPPSPSPGNVPQPPEQPPLSAGPSHHESEVARQEYADKQQAPHPRLEDAQAIAERFLREHPITSTDEAQSTDERSKQIATLTLAELNAPGDTHLHEAVFALVHQLVSTQQHGNTLSSDAAPTPM